MLMGEGLRRRRLRAPRNTGEVLIEPPLVEIDALMRQNAARRAADCDLQGCPLAALVLEARSQLVEAALRYTREYRDVAAPVEGLGPPRLAVAGHQPQLFHPGVWYKNFVLSRLGSPPDSLAVNLVIDSDTCKTASVRVPTGGVDHPLVEAVAFDGSGPEIPFEERQILDRDCLASFGRRATQLLRPLVREPLLDEFWPLVLERSRHEPKLGLCLAQARHLVEAEFGAVTLELPQSQVCELPAFHWFTAHLLANLPRFWDVYNASINEYRLANHLRSRSHPAPDLAADGPWLEAPFWIWTRDNPRRRRVFVRARGDALLLSDRDRLEVALPLTIDSDAGRAVAMLAELPARGSKLRTRALVTTMFARLVLSDVFVHGIGGAKYDEVTDLVVRRFFGVEPPGYLTATATLRLPIDRDAIGPDALERLDARLRELEFHPERFLAREVLAAESLTGGERPELAAALQTKERWIATEQTRDNARERCRAIRGANASLGVAVAPLRQAVLLQRERIAERLRGETVLNSREYAFCLFPRETLRRFLDLDRS
jgi:hypothetical protein